MPFKSRAQMRYMYARHPRIAKRWQREGDVSEQYKRIPEHVKRAKARAKRKRRS